MQYNRTEFVNSVFIFMTPILDKISLRNLQIAIVMHAERNPVFATSRMVFACAKRDTVALDATNVSQDIMVIPTVYHATVAPSVHLASVAIPQANAHASPISLEGLVVNAVQDTTSIQNALVRNITCTEILIMYNIFIKFSYTIYFITFKYFNSQDTF